MNGNNCVVEHYHHGGNRGLGSGLAILGIWVGVGIGSFNYDPPFLFAVAIIGTVVLSLPWRD